MSVFTVDLTFLAVTDRLLNDLELTVSGNGSSQSTKVGRGDRRIRVDWLNPGDTMKIQVNIPNVLDIEEDFVIRAIPTDGGKSALGFEAATPPVHSRLGFQPAVSVPDNGVLRIPLDVTFLNVTTHFAAQHFPPARLSFPGVRTLIFEFMRGRPRVWFAMVPETLLNAGRPDEVQLLLFFRPEVNRDYQDSDDIHERLPDGSTRIINPPFGFYMRYADSDTTPHTYFQPGPAFAPYPNCGFAEQVAAAGRGAVILVPIPQGKTDFGVLTAADVQQVIIEFARALQHEGIASENELTPGNPLVTRFGIAGFSIGGDAAVTAWNNSAHFVDELYLFDPGQGLRGDLLGWLRARTDRRLQLVCPTFCPAAAAALAPHIPAGQGSVRASNVDYFFSDPAYVAAHSDARLMRANGDPPEDASVLSNIFLDAERLPPASNPGVTLRGEVNGTPVIRQAFGFAQHEVAALIAGRLPFTRRMPEVIPTPPSTAQQMQKIFFQLTVDTVEDNQSLVGTHRHSWAVIGGEAGANGVKGFFQLCLEESKFA